MPQRNRRRTLIAIATLTFGASGVVASGAFNLSSQGSRPDSFVQVLGTDQTVTNRLSPADVAESSDGEGDDEEGSQGVDNSEQGDQESDQTSSENERGDDDNSDSGESDEPPTTRVQVVVDPDNPGNAINGNGSATWNGSIISSDAINETSDGFLDGFSAENLNRNTRFTFGTLDGKFPGDKVAFIIANVGPDNDTDPAVSVDVSTTLLAAGESVRTDQLQFAYEVVDSDGTRVTRGEDLLSDTVSLADGHVIEIVVIVDTRIESDDLEQLDTIRFSASAN